MTRTTAALAAALSFFSCSSNWNKTLPSSAQLGSPRGFQIARTTIHLHSPYSFDACDRAGLTNGEPDTGCMAHLRDGLCQNHIDAAFLTDHPGHMAEITDFSKLLLYKDGDTLMSTAGAPYANQLAGCGDGHQPLLSVGFEDRLMPIGMTSHISDPAADLPNDYIQETAAMVTRLKTEANAIVIVPHTESRPNSTLTALGMDGMEIYNIHANIDPKIRGGYLGLDYFDGFADLIPYWIDPFHNEEPDLAFISLFRLSDVYAEKWDSLLAAGQKPFGVGGCDAHENTVKSKANDGERVDSYRRLMRWVSNHFLVTDRSFASIKTAVAAGRSWVVFEAFGSPVGMDFYAEVSGTNYNPGESATFASGAVIHVRLPHLHPDSPHGEQNPVIQAKIIKVNADATETVVASAKGQDINYTVPGTGIYRAEVTIIPLHLSDFLNYDHQRAFVEIPWILTNPIYLQ